jgi:hypothetical protein
MKFDIDVFRDAWASVKRERMEWQVEIRSSAVTMEPFTTRSKAELAERLVEVSIQLQEIASRQGGHQAVYVYGRPLSGDRPMDLISAQKYSVYQEAWIHLSGVEFPYAANDPKPISELLDQVADPVDDPEVDDDPTPAGMRKREVWREKEEIKKKKNPGKRRPWDLPTTVMGASRETPK